MTLSAPPPSDSAGKYGIHTTFFVVSAHRGQLVQIADLIDAGLLRPTVAATYPLADGRAAFASGRRYPRSPGKTILIVDA